jgi:hypothetical protein
MYAGVPMDAEVEQLDLPRAAEEDVVGLDVAVHDFLVVRGGEHVEQLIGHEQDLLDRQAARFSLAPVGERLAVEQLHDQKDRSLVVDLVVEDGDGPRMLHLVGEIPFPQKPLADLLVDS